jgi:hypothetical protein
MAEMRCVTVSWDYVDVLSRRVAFQILEDGYEPDCVIALAKGGWFAGRVLCDYLSIDELLSLDIRHYRSVDEMELEISDFDAERIKNRRVLVVDDLINTGNTMKNAVKLIGKHAEVRTASLFMLQESDFIPDYLGEYLWDYTWVIFPWNFVEDVSGLILKILEKREVTSQWSLKGLLFSEFGLDPINLEISNPGRFEDVLKILELKGFAEKLESEGRTYWRLKNDRNCRRDPYS